MAASTPTKPKALPELLRATAQRHAADEAIVFNGQATSFAQLDDQSDRVAAALAARGIRKSDRVGLYCVNSDVFSVAYFGILKTGATVVPINLLLNPREVAFALADSGARGLIYHEAFSEAVTAARADCPALEIHICIGARASDPADVPWPAALAPAAAPEVAFSPHEDLAVIIYTSGTTGKPKGAMLTHANLAANTSSVQRTMGFEPGRDTVCLVLPMFHAFAATAGMLTPLLHGCRIAPVPKFDPHLVAQTIAETGATVFMGVPSMYNTLLRLPGEATPKFRSLRLCASGGAAMPGEVMKAFEARFGTLIYEGDGPTECSPVTCCNPIGGTRKLGSVGPPVPDVEMCIMDDDGQPLATGDVGEICVRGPNVMKGYWERPEETRESFFDEWFRTGDLGYVDEDGYFYIVDRKKDMIIVNGMNVYPRVVEEILYQFEPVHEAAVVGEPSERHGEIPVAYIALIEGQATTGADVRAFCRDHLGRHQVPRKVFIVDELPKNAAGKILKRQLRTQGELERGIDNRTGENV